MTGSRSWTRPLAVVGALAIAAAAALAAVTPVHAATSWTLQSSPNPGSVENALHAVACPDATHCWAVGGTAGSGGFTQALIEQWNGSAWSVDTVPDENGIGGAQQYNVLEGISCISNTDCWAVGFFNNGSNDEPLWEYWDGSTWTVSTFLVGVSTSYRLYGVSCVDDTHCWAVGSKYQSTNTVWFQQWNGTTWTDDPSTDQGSMNGVSCVDATHCWAVGTGGTITNHTVIEAWDGSQWTLSSSPNSGTGNNDLNAVSCVSTTWCWTVGAVSVGTSYQNLFEKWDGSSWSIPADTTASNNNSPAQQRNGLDGVICESTTYCWGVGSYGAINAGNRTLIDSWNGTSWTFVPNTPNAGTPAQGDALAGVACAGTTFCAAVGDYFSPDPTLILQYQVAAPTPTPTPTGIPVPASGGAPAVQTGSAFGLLIAAAGVLLLLGSIPGYVGRRRTGGSA